jgi:hypothetical protein
MLVVLVVYVLADRRSSFHLRFHSAARRYRQRANSGGNPYFAGFREMGAAGFEPATSRV